MNADAQFAVADASTAADPLHAMVVRMGEHVDAAAVSTVDAKNAEVAPGATAPVKMALSFADAARSYGLTPVAPGATHPRLFGKLLPLALPGELPWA